MARREKLIAKMRATPGNIRFHEIRALIKYAGFVLFNQRGSHLTFHHADGRLVTIVRPHAGQKTCHPADVEKLLRVLGYENDA
jgi:predicted RNA binding protein YcfA (HicA-like mRNA interferase family)